jgi:hypothetical protein
MSTTTLELVVAHYQENLNWLRKVPAPIRKTIYTKAETPLALFHKALPNVGREAHTYLHHIVSQYDSLADYTIFCQGKPFDHTFDFHAKLRSLAVGRLPEKTFTWLGHIIDTDTPDGQLFREWSKNETGEGLDLAGFHQTLFGTEGPGQYPFVLGAQFVVSRELIRQNPRTFYEHALGVSLSFPQAAHCYERTWDRVFGLEGINRTWLAGRKTVYLKRVKRLE